jgi:hypothetical protein
VLVFVLLTAILALVAVGATTTLTVIRTLELVRRFRAFTGAVGGALDELSTSADRVAAKAASLGEHAVRLEPAFARLAVSRGRLAVLLAAWADVRAAVTRVTGLRPTK